MNLDLRQIWNGLRKYWWLALIVTLTSAAVAYLYENSQPRVYQTQVRLVAQPLIAGPEGNAMIEAIKKTMPTYAQELGSKELIRQVLDRNLVRDVDPNTAAGQLQVQALPDENALVMRVDDTDPTRAAMLADLISRAFIERQSSLYQETASTSNRTIWTITQAAEPAARPYKPRPLLASAAAALFGLVLGLLLAIGLELLDRTLKNPDEVRQYLGLSTLGVIPREKGPRGDDRRPAPSPRSGQADDGWSEQPLPGSESSQITAPAPNPHKER